MLEDVPDLDVIIVPIGGGGIISGIATAAKDSRSDIQVIGVDTEGSVYRHFQEHKVLPPPEEIHPYLVDGIGEDFVPGCVWWDYIDRVITIDDSTGYQTTMELARTEGIFCGSSGGCAAAAARQVARSLDSDALVVCLFPDSGERYLSKLNDQWLREKGLLNEPESPGPG